MRFIMPPPPKQLGQERRSSLSGLERRERNAAREGCCFCNAEDAVFACVELEVGQQDGLDCEGRGDGEDKRAEFVLLRDLLRVVGGEVRPVGCGFLCGWAVATKLTQESRLRTQGSGLRT